MLPKFWEGLGGKLADRWSEGLVGAPSLFYLGGVLAYLMRFGAHGIEKWYRALDEPLKVAALIAVPVIPLVTFAILRPWTFSVLRLLEGYWPEWVPFRDALIRHLSKPVDIAAFQWQQLNAKGLEALTPVERREYVAADRRVRRMPVNPDDRMATRLGNVLRASENLPNSKYGLDAVVCWPRLWLVLSEASRAEISAARATLDSAVHAWMFGVLFISWTIVGFVPGPTPSSPWMIWPVAVGLLAAALAYHSAIIAAEVYGDLIESAYDLYRFSLYEQLRFPSPTATTDEAAAGEGLTEYLARGQTAKRISLTKP